METNHGADLLRKFKEEFAAELRAQAERLEAAENGLREARDRHRQLAESFEQQTEVLEKLLDLSSAAAPPVGKSSPANQPATRGPSAPPDPGQKVLNDAQRFARLLVSEIEMYHRDQVAAGREHRDLYSRLRSTIERSQQAYDKRFGSTPAAPFHYFHHELVKALAANDPALLGPEYSGPAS